jgi:hypothetical protein
MNIKVLVKKETVHPGDAEWTAYIEKKSLSSTLDVSILTKNYPSFNDQFIEYSSVVYGMNSLVKMFIYMDFRKESLPYTNDLEIWAQECLEELICTAAVFQPSEILSIADGWTPEISIAAIKYWKKLQQYRCGMLNASIEIQSKIANDVMFSVPEFFKHFLHLYELLNYDQSFKGDVTAPRLARECFSHWYALKGGYKLYDIVSPLISKGLDIWIQIKPFHE